MKITYFGTTTLLFDDGTDQILFDCHVTRPPMLRAMFGSFKSDGALVKDLIRRFDIDRLKGIFISHSHYDHVLDAPSFARLSGADVYGSRSALNVLRGGGIDEMKLHDYAAESCFCVGAFKVTVIPSLHSKAHWYNNDLGKEITEPLAQPAKKSDFKEGGSFDFLAEHNGRTYLIRPSYNFIEGQLDGIGADVVFLGVAGLAADTPERKEAFFRETLKKVSAQLVLPVHWDNFFRPLSAPVQANIPLASDNARSLRELEAYCGTHRISYRRLDPLTSVEI